MPYCSLYVLQRHGQNRHRASRRDHPFRSRLGARRHHRADEPYPSRCRVRTRARDRRKRAGGCGAGKPRPARTLALTLPAGERQRPRACMAAWQRSLSEAGRLSGSRAGPIGKARKASRGLQGLPGISACPLQPSGDSARLEGREQFIHVDLRVNVHGRCVGKAAGAGLGSHLEMNEAGRRPAVQLPRGIKQS